MRLVVAMILAIVTFSSAATASGVWRAGQIPADPEIRLLILIHQFERVALHAPEGLLPVISRYENPLSYALVSDDRDALAIYGPVIERRMEQLAELTGQSATKSPAATATVNISLVPCQRRREYVPARRRKIAPRASAVACPGSPQEGPARGAKRPPRGWRRPARGRSLWAHGGKRGVIRTGVVGIGSA